MVTKRFFVGNEFEFLQTRSSDIDMDTFLIKTNDVENVTRYFKDTSSWKVVTHVQDSVLMS